MIDLILLVLIVIVFVKISDLRHSIDELKRHNKTREISKPEEHTQIVQPKKELYQVEEKQNNIPLEDWLKENLLLKIGVLMILIGAGWFVSYAFVNNWISPLGRIAIGILIGTLITIFGTSRLGKSTTQGTSFTVLGSALVIISVLSGQYFYNFFSAPVTLAIVFLVSVYTTLTAVAFSTKKLAVYGLIVSIIAPLLSGLSLETNSILIYSYFLIVSIATIWVSVAKDWRELNVVGILGVAWYSLSIMPLSHYIFEGDRYTVLAIAYIISLLYMTVGAWSLINSKQENKGATSKDVFLSIVNSLMILYFTIAFVPSIFQSLTLALWMILFAIVGFIVFQKTNDNKLFIVFSLISILFLSIATAIELEGTVLVIAFAIEASIISVASFIATNKINIAKSFGLLMVVPVLLSFGSIASQKWTTVFHEDFAVLMVMAVTLFILGMFFRENTKDNKMEFRMDSLFLIISSLYILIIIWLSTHAVLSPDTAVFISLFIYTGLGLSTYFIGLFNGGNILKKYGAVILILVVIRLVLIDVWNMELVLRVVTFVVLGIMFISTAFISKEHKKQIK